MTRKTESLAYPADPLAAIRELQELNTRPGTSLSGARDRSADMGSTPKRRSPSPPGSAALPPTPPAGSAVANVGGSEGSSATSSPEGSETRLPRTTPANPAEPDAAANEPKGNRDPMADAVREMLSRPYTSDSGKGPFTVSTVKVPTEVWERLGWVSAWTGRPKQEIIADALKDHFGKVLKGR